MNNTTLYHLTTKYKLPSIMQNGLIPGIGSNSKKVLEEVQGVYLCTKKDVKYWQILLECDMLIEITGIDLQTCEERRYSLYNEYIYKSSIEPSCLQVIKLPKISIDAMKELCFSYMQTISMATVFAARYYNSNNTKAITMLDGIITDILAVAKRLDYKVLTDEEKSKWLIDYGNDGEYTFLDTYMNTETKLFQQLARYPKDSLSEKRIKLYNYINNTFKAQLHLNTGGWTG